MKNRYRSLILILPLFLFAFVSKSRAQWEQTNGPYGGVINSVACSGSVLFAGTNAGLYRSTDGGLNWSPVKLPNNPAFPLLKIFRVRCAGGAVFVSTENGVFISRDDGGSWKETVVPAPGELVSNLEVNGNVIAYASSLSGAHASYLSVDTLNDSLGQASRFGGIAFGNWSADTVVQSLAFLNTRVFVGTNFGIFVSADTGKTWASCGSAVAGADVKAMTAMGSAIFAAIRSGEVFESTDGGTTWLVRNQGGTSFSSAVLVARSDTLYAGTSGQGVFFSTDSGRTWIAENSGLVNPLVSSIAFLGGEPVAGTSGSGVFSFNGTWSPMSYGLSATSINCFTTLAGNLYAATGGSGVFVSTDGGTDWKAVNSGLDNLDVQSIIANGGVLFAGTYGGGVFRSTDGGASWTAVNSGIKDMEIHVLATYGTDILAGTTPRDGLPAFITSQDYYMADSGQVYLSTDNGGNWAVIDTGLFTVNALASSGNAILVAGIFGTERSTDNGGTWASSDSGLSYSTGRGLSITPTVLTIQSEGGDLYAGTESAGVYRSTDGGISWSGNLSGLTKSWPNVIVPSTFAIPAVDADSTEVFCSSLNSYPDGSELGVYAALREGNAWSQVDSGLDGNFTGLLEPAVRALAVSDGYLFGGTNGFGVWRVPLSNVTGVESPEAKVPAHFSLSQNYPNPFNPTTVISYQLSAESRVSLKVYDVLGRLVRALVQNEVEKMGSYEVQFNGSDLPSGVYFYRIVASPLKWTAIYYEATRKLMLIK